MKVVSDTAHGILDYLTSRSLLWRQAFSALPALLRLSHTRSLPFILS